MPRPGFESTSARRVALTLHQLRYRAAAGERILLMRTFRSKLGFDEDWEESPYYAAIIFLIVLLEKNASTFLVLLISIECLRPKLILCEDNVHAEV